MKQKLLLLMLVVLIALPALAHDFQYTYEGQTITYTVIDEEAMTCTICSTREGLNIKGNLILPEHPMDNQNEYTLISIGDYAFTDNTDLISITIPSSVEYLAPTAFSRCNSLIEINVAIGNKYFTSLDGNVYSIDMTELVRVAPGKINVDNLSEKLLYIGEDAFCRTEALLNVILPSSVISIKNRCFDKCSSLISVKLPESLEYIGEDAFYGCWSLPSISIPQTVKYIDEHAFDSCVALTSFEFPELVNMISHGIFVGCDNLTTVSIPRSVDSIGDEAFLHCYNLKKIFNRNPIPQKVDGSRCFEGVSSDMEVYVPKESYVLYQTSDDWGRGRFIIKIIDYEQSPDINDQESVFLTVLSPDKGKVKYQYPLGYNVKFSVDCADGWNIESVRFNDIELTADNNGVYSTGELNDNGELQIVYSMLESEIERIDNGLCQVKIYMNGRDLVIEGREENDSVSIYNENGMLIFNGYNDIIKIDSSTSIIIVKIGHKTYKLLL